MKFYIDKNLQIRASESGWPPLLSYPTGTFIGLSHDKIEEHNKALEKAKAESVLLEDQENLTIRLHVHGIECYADTFVEAPLEVDFYDLPWAPTGAKFHGAQKYRACRLKPAGSDIPSTPFPQNPQVSGVEGPWSVGEEEKLLSSFTEISPAPEKQRCEYELAVEKYFGLVNWPVEEPIEEGSDYTNLVNLLAMFDQENRDTFRAHIESTMKHNKDLSAQLAAAEKRVKELESWQEEEMLVWNPVLDYAQENSERLGINIGQSISSGILRILKTFNQPGAERKG